MSTNSLAPAAAASVKALSAPPTNGTALASPPTALLAPSIIGFNCLKLPETLSEFLSKPPAKSARPLPASKAASPNTLVAFAVLLAPAPSADVLPAASSAIPTARPAH